MNDESRALRQDLVELFNSYNGLVADKDAVDFRLGSREPYAESKPGMDPERIYEIESESLGADLRAVLIKMIGIAQRIRTLEGF
ncbi:MAG TPA: hypothetical protein VGZ02_16670 [Candidatus Baltobacteraceae bacterium]|jgi:hypothetical protein|nr:hypothetical protein [Candidatus Baltobacteraceae bacterium]